MATTITLQDIQFRRGTEAFYTTNNPLLQIGEPAFEIDTYKFKIGNGVDLWNQLPYVAGSGGSTGVTSINGLIGVVTLDADSIDDSSTIKKFTTGANLNKLSYITVTQNVNLDTLESTANTALQSYTETDPIFGASAAASITTGDIIKLSNLSGTNTGDQDISGITTNANAIASLISEQNIQDNAIALNTAKVSYPGPQNASEVSVSPTINTNSNVQTVLIDHESRIDAIEGASITDTRTYVNSTSNGLTGTQNGINQAFTVSQGNYLPGSLLVFVSGFPISTGQGLTETTPSSGIFTLDVAPQSYDIIIVQYSN